MTTPTATVTAVSRDAIRDLIRDLQGFGAVLQEELEVATADVLHEVREQTDKADAVASGEFYLGWSADRKGYTLSVTNSAPHAYWSENGRGPGKMPPIGNIEAWIRNKGLAPQVSPWAIAMSIAENGTKGAHVVDASTPYIKNRLRSAIQRALRKVGK